MDLGPTGPDLGPVLPAWPRARSSRDGPASGRSRLWPNGPEPAPNRARPRSAWSKPWTGGMDASPPGPGAGPVGPDRGPFGPCIGPAGEGLSPGPRALVQARPGPAGPGAAPVPTTPMAASGRASSGGPCSAATRSSSPPGRSSRGRPWPRLGSRRLPWSGLRGNTPRPGREGPLRRRGLSQAGGRLRPRCGGRCARDRTLLVRGRVRRSPGEGRPDHPSDRLGRDVTHPGRDDLRPD